MKIINEMRLDFLAIPENESFARLAISAFVLPVNPTLSQLGDVKTAVSEAVTNAIIHGYQMRGGTVRLHATLSERQVLTVDVIDNGCGIADVARARTPFYTTLADMDRSGMGFTVMESFMDAVEVASDVGRGTTVRMVKDLSASDEPAARQA